MSGSGAPVHFLVEYGHSVARLESQSAFQNFPERILVRRWYRQIMALKDLIRTIPDHPKAGIAFRDITTLLLDADGFHRAVDEIAEPYMNGLDSVARPELVVGIEARGFIFGTAIAYSLGLGFVPLRKHGKLPGKTIGREFELEYGHDRIEMHIGAIKAHQKVLLVDDLIATGGTAEAAVQLIREVGAEIIESVFVIALPDLGGVERLRKIGCSVRSLCEFEGD